MSKNKGWKGDRQRHSMASRGIITKPNTKISYEPYDGPAGPEMEQIIKNNKALKAMLEDLYYDVEETDMYHINPIDFDYGDAPVLKIGTLVIGYDRWGFVGEDLEGKVEWLDQASLAESFKWVTDNV